MFNEFPYTNYEKINLDWLLDLGNKLKADAESGEFDGERGKGIFGITTIYAGGEVGGPGYYCGKIGDAGVGDFVIGYGPAAGHNNLYLMKVTSVSGNYLEGTTLLQITGPQGQPGAQGADGQPGAQGADGQPGQNGVSPVVSVTSIQNGHRVTITDVNGTQSFDVINGDGAVIIDSALSTTSTNPVENRVIAKALQGDTTDFAEYLNPVYTTNIINNDGSLGTGNAKVTQFLPVTPGETLTLSNSLTTKIAYYDEGKAFINIVSITSGIHEYIVPNNAAFARYQNIYNGGDPKPLYVRRKNIPVNKSFSDLVLSPLKTVIDIGFTGDSNTKGYGLATGEKSWADLFGDALSGITTIKYSSPINPWIEIIGASGYSSGFNFKVNSEISIWTDANNLEMEIANNYSSKWAWYVDGVATGDVDTSTITLDGALHKVTAHFTSGQAVNPRFVINKTITYSNHGVVGVALGNVTVPTGKDWLFIMIGTNNRNAANTVMRLLNSFDEYAGKGTFVMPFPNHKTDVSYVNTQLQTYAYLIKLFNSIHYDIVNLGAENAYPFFSDTLYQSDKIHFNANGHKVIANMVSGYLGLPIYTQEV